MKRLGLDRDAIVFFASDNGPWYQDSAGPLRGRKGWTFDGGVRVPGIVRWPGHIRSGRVSDEPATTIDFFATALSLVGDQDVAVRSKQPLDGKDLLAFLLGRERKTPENTYLFFHGRHLQTARGPLEDSRRSLEHPQVHGSFESAKEFQMLIRPEVSDYMFKIVGGSRACSFSRCSHSRS